MSKKLLIHEKYLKEKIFFSEKKWPQYNLLINDIKLLSKKTKKNSKILFLERTNLYGGVSLLAPFFKLNKTMSLDCSTKKILNRKSYVKNLKNEKNIIFKKFDEKIIKKNYFDLIIIPNLIHHLKNSDQILKKSFELLKKNGQVYIFEPILREIHQKPDDYIRYTPYGMKAKLNLLGFQNIKFKTTGGPFSATIYCLDQAIQYLPNKLKKKYSDKIFPKLYKEFMVFEKKYKLNRVRKHTMFPTAFSIIGKK